MSLGSAPMERSDVIEMPYVRQATAFPVRYAYGPDSFPQEGVPRGVVHEHEWSESEVFPGTTRRYSVYVPAQYTPEAPASLVVFQDGHVYLDPEGAFRAGVVLDNLIHRGEMPVTVGVFVDPGEPDNRNAEYDAFDDAYATFLLTEILPGVLESYRIADDPDRWAICGGSAGGNCAFTVGWLRTDRFRKVASFLGSFAQMEGGNPYLNLIAKTPRKPLRIFLQAGTRDLYFDEAVFNWYSTNLRMAAALAERGYDFRLVLGDGEHSAAPGNHGAAILPDALRWLWRQGETPNAVR
jgi:enterochelin esterase-like enzyme